MIVAMPRDGAIVFSDLIGKLDVLRVSCSACERDGCYGLNRLINERGRDAKLIDWLDELTAECPKKIARNMNGPVRCEVSAITGGAIGHQDGGGYSWPPNLYLSRTYSLFSP
jgi:hypothetical protein